MNSHTLDSFISDMLREHSSLSNSVEQSKDPKTVLKTMQTVTRIVTELYKYKEMIAPK